MRLNYCADCQRSFCDRDCPGGNCRRHYARNLCKPCYVVRERRRCYYGTQTVTRPRRKPKPVVETVEDLMTVAGYRPDLNYPSSVRRIAAERLGMTPGALNQALRRYKRLVAA